MALLVSGMLDGISVVVRGTITQLKTPDHMRGRVMSVNSMFVNSSNELGQFESGIAAKLMGGRSFCNLWRKHDSINSNSYLAQSANFTKNGILNFKRLALNELFKTNISYGINNGLYLFIHSIFTGSYYNYKRNTVNNIQALNPFSFKDFHKVFR